MDKDDTNEFELVKELIIESYKSNIIQHDINLITFEDVNLFTVNDSISLNNNVFKTKYCNLVNYFCKKFFIDFCLCTTDLVSNSLNSIFSYNFNKDVYFFRKNKKSLYKKNIENLNHLIEKYKEINDINNTPSSVNILIPILFNNNSELQIYLKQFVAALNNLILINRVVILNIFDIFNIKKINNLGIYEISVVNKNDIFDILSSEKLITNDKLNSLRMFLQQDQIVDINTKNKHNKLNNLYLSLLNTKKSRVCVNLDSIKDSTELIKFTNMIGEYISAIRINSNNIFNEKVLVGLRKLADHHKFIIIDDKRHIINSKDDFPPPEIFKYIDIISVNISFFSKEIDTFFLKIRDDINQKASIVISNINNIDYCVKQNEFYKEICFGIIGIDNSNKNAISIIDYKKLSNLNDNFLELRRCDMTLIGDELINQKNPIEILNKINKIMFHSTQ